MTRLIVYLAYFLKSSQRYQKCKAFFYDVLENPHSRLKSYFDIFMILLVMLSVFMLIYEVDQELDRAGEIFERVVVTIFIIEYLLRGWLYNHSHLEIIDQYEKAEYLDAAFKLRQVFFVIAASKIKFVLSPSAIIDLLAILPSYRPLRILRIFLIFRLFKLFRYSQSIKLFTDVLASKRFELYTLAVFSGFLVFIASTAIYMFENEKDGGQIKHLYDSVYWTIVTASTVGYGDITPQSTGGRVVALGLIISGLGVLSFFTSIIVAAFSEKLYELRENQTYTELEKFNDFVIVCGYGRVGQEIARHLHKNKIKFIIIDKTEQNIILAKKQRYLVIHADASNNEVLVNAGINNGAANVLCTTGDDVTNVYIVLTSRRLNKHICIISRANRQENVKKLQQAGADHVIQPFEISGLLAVEYIGQPVAFEAIHGILREEKKIRMETVLIHENSFIDGQQIGDINFEHRKLRLIGVISSNSLHVKHKNRYKVKDKHFYFNPEAHFVLQGQDILVLLGREYSLDHFNSLIKKSRLIK